jgi:protein-disulfide isomerase
MNARPRGPKKTTRDKSAALVAGQRLTDRTRKILIQVAVAAVLIALVGAIGISIAHKKASREQASTGAVPTAAGEDGVIRIGSTTPSHVVTAVEDFQCPACKQFEATSAATLTELAAGPVAVDYRPIAILDRMSSTNYSTRAASAAYCVAEANLEKWPSWHAAMFAQQPPEGGTGLTDDRIIEIAVSVGIDRDHVAECISSHKYADYVQTNSKRATDSGISHTPTVSVDGREISDPNPVTLRAAVAS